MSATTGDEIYVYDSLGNRVTYTDQRNATTRAYANNLANEYTSVATYAVTHDAAGNLWKQVVNGSGDAYVYAYDCDNRLLQVDYDPNSGSNTTVATFAYDALGRKITAWTQYDGLSDSQTADLRFYHDGQAEIADYHSDGTLARRFINGTQYIDERVALIEGEAAEADTFYYLLQELYTVTGLVEKNGALAEADVVDGYGKVRLWDYSPGDFDRDGDVDATDQGTFVAAMGLGVNGTPTPDPSTDLDMDGDTDLTDAGLFTTIKNAGGAVAERFVSVLGNPFHFTGRRLYRLETLPEANGTPVANQQLQHNRARHYSPLEGRWLQRDPMLYVDGTNLYEYVGSNSSRYSDSQGLEVDPVDIVPIKAPVHPLEGEIKGSKIYGQTTMREDPPFKCELCTFDRCCTEICVSGGATITWWAIPYPSSIQRSLTSEQHELKHVDIYSKSWNVIRGSANNMAESSRTECWDHYCANHTCKVLQLIHDLELTTANIDNRELDWQDYYSPLPDQEYFDEKRHFREGIEGLERIYSALLRKYQAAVVERDIVCADSGASPINP